MRSAYEPVGIFVYRKSVSEMTNELVYAKMYEKNNRLFSNNVYIGF